MLNKLKSLKNAFTLTEVLVATLISSIVLWFIFVYLSDMSTWIQETKSEVIMMSRVYDFTHKLENFRNIYTSWAILVDNTSTWSDVFIMKDISWKNGILMWVVNVSNNKLDTDTTLYADRWIWFRKLSEYELWEISSNVNFIYDYIFQEDNIYSDIKVQEFNLTSYNSWTIFELGLTYDLNYQVNLIWQFWADLPKWWLKKINIDF